MDDVIGGYITCDEQKYCYKKRGWKEKEGYMSANLEYDDREIDIIRVV